MKDHVGDKRVLRGCAQNYSGAQFIVPIPAPNTIPSWAPCPVGEWVEEFSISCMSTTVRYIF